MNRRAAVYLLPIVVACLAAQTPTYAEQTDYGHFAGRYAFEATPYWAEFEIARAGDDFVIRMPDGEKWADLKRSEGLLAGKDDDGRDISLKYDPKQDRYLLAGTTQLSSFQGLQDVRSRWIVVKAAPMPGKDLEERFGVTAASLVRRVRESEQWMRQFDSLRFTAEITWTHTADGIEHRKKDIQIRHPDADLSRERFWGLTPVQEGREEFCIDRRRFRVSETYRDKSEQVQLWDGQCYTSYRKFFTHDQEDYYIAPDLGNHGQFMLDGLSWPRSQYHRFWWHGDVQDEASHDGTFGRVEEFVLTGKGDYRGVPCYVLECIPKELHRVRRWYVGVEDGLLRGNLIYEQGQLSSEHWTDGYRQVQPGWWFPTIQGYHLFEYAAMVRTQAENISRDDGLDYFIAGRRDIRVTSVEVNRPLADALFRMEFKEGVKVADLRFGGIVTYRYKKDMTEQEWEQIRQQALRRLEDDVAQRRALDARIGQEAPAFPAACKWLNSQPLTWQDLHGKAVVLQFWGCGCGPCHNYISALRAPKGDSDVVFIGVHVPQDDMDVIKELMAKYKADGPVCVDAPAEQSGQGFGVLSSWFSVRAIPSWCVVGPDGKVAGHSMQLGEAARIAYKTLPAARQ